MEFETVWRGIEEMRRERLAPVDTMGCDRLAHGHTPQAHRFQVLVSLLLSSQTRDEVTAAAIGRLLAAFGNKFDVESARSSSLESIEGLLYPVGFYRRKAHYLKQIADILHAKYDDDIPASVEELVELPGIGPKMAHLIMLAAWNKVTGIGVDVHVLRISHRLGWISEDKDPERARRELESVVPKSKWSEINHLLVGFGQTICLPRNPKCNQCIVRRLCNYYKDKYQSEF